MKSTQRLWRWLGLVFVLSMLALYAWRLIRPSALRVPAGALPVPSKG